MNIEQQIYWNMKNLYLYLYTIYYIPIYLYTIYIDIIEDSRSKIRIEKYFL